MNSENPGLGGSIRPPNSPLRHWAMYRIRLASGAETTYQSMDELAAALQGGTVTAEATIYHQRADRWLSITNHPHYQIALSRAAATAPKGDGSRRQVISAVRPAGEVPATRVSPSPEVPLTVARDQIHEMVAELEKESDPKAARKLTIPPAPKKPDAQHYGNGQSNGGGPKTTAIPIRKVAPAPAKPSVNPPASPVPDLGDGLDLVEEIVAEAPAPKRLSTATPQVDKLLEMLEPTAPAPVAAKPVHQLEPVQLLDLNAPLPHAAAPVPAVANHEPAAPAPATGSRRSKGGNNSKILGLAAAAVLVIGGVTFLWKPWSRANALPEGTDIASTTLPRTEAFGGSSGSPAPTTAQISGSEMPGASASGDSAKGSARPVDDAPAIVRVAAPRNLNIAVPTANLIASNGGSGLNISAGVLIQHYNAAYTDARSELELRMLQIGFTQIFLRSRLTTGSGVQDTRRLIASASSAMRQYRSDETQIERGYQDTVGVAGRNLGWTPRDLGAWNMKPGQKESAETLRLTNLMLSQMDSTFSLLAEQEGKFHVSGDAITFQDSDAARQYGALRVWLNQQADKYSGSGDALPATLRQVVKAIGGTRLPQERR
jgi:hypothetical protein